MEREKRYRTYEKKDMIVKDYLAADRTLLANERTYLSYLRTVVSLLAAGVGLIKYVDGGNFTKVIGYLFITGSLGALIIGSKKFIKTLHPLRRILG